MDLSEQRQTPDFAEWIVTDGAWMVFLRDERPGWTHVWPTTTKKPEGLLRSREEALELQHQLESKGGKVVLLRIGPDATEGTHWIKLREVILRRWVESGLIPETGEEVDDCFARMAEAAVGMVVSQLHGTKSTEG